MGRIRTIKPEFFTDDDLAQLSPFVRLVFIGLWTHADKAGRLEDRPRRLKVLIAPYDDCDFPAALDALVAGGFLQRYQVDGHRFLHVRTWMKHQRPHHTEADSVLPAPPCGNGEATVREPLLHRERDEGQKTETAKHGAHSDFRGVTVMSPLEHGDITDGREGKGKERKGMGGSEASTIVDARTPHTPLPSAPLTGPARALQAWTHGYETATGQPAMLRQGKADQDARAVSDWLTKAKAWADLDVLVELFLTAPEFDGKLQLGMFAANLPQLAAWLREHGPGVLYGDEDAKFRAERARELAKLTPHDTTRATA